MLPMTISWAVRVVQVIGAARRDIGGMEGSQLEFVPLVKYGHLVPFVVLGNFRFILCVALDMHIVFI